MLDKTAGVGSGSSTGDIRALLELDDSSSTSRRLLGKLRWWFMVPALIAAGGLALWLHNSTGGSLTYVTAPATRGDLTVVVTATGSAQPITQVNISSELSGTVRKVMVDYNSIVERGQPLAELDTDKIKAAVDNSRAKLEAARARVADAAAAIDEKRGSFERKRELANRDIASAQDLELAKSAYDRALAAHASAIAEVKVAEADLRLNEINLTKSCICSPINGVVLTRNVDPGQIVASSLQAPVLFVIAEDLRRMELRVDVDEADVGKVKVGQKATFGVDAYPGRRFPAEISDVRYGSEIIQGVVTYKAILSIENADLLIRPGMTVTAEIVVERVDNALKIPNAALRFAPPSSDASRSSQSFLQRLIPGPPSFRRPSRQAEDGPDRTIWVLRHGQPTPVSVVTGASDGRSTQVSFGELSAGEPVITDTVASKR